MKPTSYHSDESSKYAKISLKGEGTLYLSFRDIEWLIAKQFPNQSLKNLKALDYGCGAGRSTRYLKSIGIHEVDGFDISEEMIQLAHGFDPQGNYKIISSGSIPTSNANYDMAFMSFVTVAVDKKEEIAQIFNEISRVLKGGILILLTLSETFCNPKHQWVSYKQDYPENYNPKSGQKIRLIITPINFDLVVSYWVEKDIIHCAQEAQLSLLDIHHPLGKKEDEIIWKDEIHSTPYTIFTFKK